MAFVMKRTWVKESKWVIKYDQNFFLSTEQFEEENGWGQEEEESSINERVVRSRNVEICSMSKMVM